MLELDFSQQLGELNLQVTQTLPAQGITAIFGLSGAGKTSLINAIGGLTRPDSGHISLNGRVLSDADNKIFLPPEKRRVGYVFQDARLFPHYRVKGNLQYGMAASMRGQFDSIVQLLGIESLLDRFPLTLSGGEKQRVAIGRALLTAPEILLMDEPTANLDYGNQFRVMERIGGLTREGYTVILTTHNPEHALLFADKAFVLKDGEVKAAGPSREVITEELMKQLYDVEVKLIDTEFQGENAKVCVPIKSA